MTAAAGIPPEVHDLAERDDTLAVAHRRWTYPLLRRTGRLIGSAWVLVTASFFMIHLVPGDPVRAAMGLTAPKAAVRARRQALHLDDPLGSQYLRFLRDVLRGRLGTSIASGEPVTEQIKHRLPATLELAGASFVLVLLTAVPLGVLVAALTRGGRRRGLHLGFASTSVLLASVPDFLLGVVLVYVFAVRSHWFPPAGRSGGSSFVLPVLALGVGAAAVLARIVRVEMLSVLAKDYIRTARAKRLPAVDVYLKHALPNAITATTTVAGMLLTSLIAGTVLVENVFAWPGLGQVLVTSIQQKDYPMVQGLVLVYGGIVLVVTLAVDLALAALGPRSVAGDR